MYTNRNVDILQIGGTANITTANYPDGLNTGEIGVFTPEGIRMTEASALTNTRFMVAYKLSDGVVVSSPTYNKADITGGTVGAYAAKANQIDFIGYNGTSGSIQAINSNLYKVDIQVQELLRANSDGRRIKFGFYQSDSSATQAEIAIGLVDSLVDNFDREAEQYITFESICNDAGAIIPTGAGTVAVVKGSKTILFNTDVDDATGATLLLINEFLRFGTAVTDDVYKIISINTTTDTIVLDRPYQGTTNAAVANNAVERITVALGAAADWGVSMTGANLDFTVGKFNEEVVRWDTQLKDFGTTTETFSSTSASLGQGTVNIVSQLEWFNFGSEGEVYREGFSTIHPSRTNVDSAVAGSGYDILRLTFNGTHTVGFQNQIAPQVLTLAIPATVPQYADGGQADDITDIFEALSDTIAAGDLAMT